MALIVKDRIKETSTTTGTGAFTLAGAVTGFKTFASVCATNDTCYYCIEAVNASGVPTGEWETGLGTYSAANTLTRTTFSDSSTGSAVSFAAGTKNVYISLVSAQVTVPIFKAHSSGAQTPTVNVTTKVSLQTEDIDTHSFFDNATNYRFTPQIKGYYSITGWIEYDNSTTNSMKVADIFLNGAAVDYTSSYAVNTLANNTVTSNVVVFLNGSSDYIELFGIITAGTSLSFVKACLSGFLIRAA